MNPANVRTQADAFKVREAYLANLRAEQRNLDKTARAVSVFQQTGQTPVPPQDTRTVSEKLMDVERLKTDLRKQLLSVTDGKEAGIIMSELEDDEVVQASALLSDIINQLKPKFPLGIPAAIFIEFLRRYLRDFSRNYGVASGDQDRIASELRLSNDQLSQVLPNQQTMIELLRVLTGIASSPLQREATRAAESLSSMIPDPQVFAAMDSMLNEVERQEASEVLNAIVENVPNQEQVRKVTKDLIDAQRSGSQQEVKKALNDALEIVSVPDEELVRMRQAMNIISTIGMEETPSVSPPKRGGKSSAVSNERFRMASEDVLSRQLSGERREEPVKQDRAGKIADIMSMGPRGGAKTPSKVRKVAELIINIEDAALNELDGVLGLTKKEDIVEWYDYLKRTDVGEPLSQARRKELLSMPRDELIADVKAVKAERGADEVRFLNPELSQGGERTLQGLKEVALQEASADYGGPKFMPSYGKGLIKGKGLKRSQRFPERVDFEKGIKADKTYIPFGKYTINNQKLAGGTLMIKTMKGGAIPKLPTIGISPALGGIIKKMIGGGLPSYNEMSELSDDEKNTLYKVFKLSQIDKADLLPSPDKTKDEQEMNRFQILKGQIQAGNDNKELIKEFKVMLLKFINGGKIPKAQGMDIITELMAMGY
jgi:hypothetical protein